MRLIKSLFQSVLQLLRSWYTVDRVRVSPTAGRLLSLQVDDRILIRGDLFTVVKRQTTASRGGIRLAYQLESDGGGARLSVESATSGTSHVSELRTNNGSASIYEDEVVELRRSVETVGNPQRHD